LAELTQILGDYGYALIFISVFLDQAGVPLPAPPLLLAAGAMAGTGELYLPLTIAAAVAGSMPSDLLWYGLGRRRGSSVLRLLCRLSIEPDSCVRSSENIFERHGPRSLLVAKFIPGIQTAAPPLAGVFGMPLPRFLAYDGGGAVIWSASFLLLGFAFHEQIGQLLQGAEEVGGQAVGVLAAIFLAYLVVKFVNRQLFLRKLRVARVTPERAKELLDTREVAVVDLRHPMQRRLEPRTLPGAVSIGVDEIEARHEEIPRDRDVILFCT
jgi:membrane protein DedA with SNARE-associated domain